ncbi:hypothetical protein IBX38_06325 [Candidatus Bathyarchaeota archaeon]|nr:hypothetical protein [Candidatus Bathyarchaeota archaeon]
MVFAGVFRGAETFSRGTRRITSVSSPSFLTVISKSLFKNGSTASPYLVTTDAYMDKAKQLVEGSFHEMGKALKIVNWRKIQELYDARKRVDEIESETNLA